MQLLYLSLVYGWTSSFYNLNWFWIDNYLSIVLVFETIICRKCSDCLVVFRFFTLRKDYLRFSGQGQLVFHVWDDSHKYLWRISVLIRSYHNGWTTIDELTWFDHRVEDFIHFLFFFHLLVLLLFLHLLKSVHLLGNLFWREQYAHSVTRYFLSIFLLLLSWYRTTLSIS